MNHKRKLNLKKQLACIYTADLFSGLRITDAVVRHKIVVRTDRE